MKRFLTGLFCACVITAGFSAAADAQTGSFSDIQGHWAQAAMEKAAEKNWIPAKSSGLFAPEAEITRGEFLFALAQLDGAPQDTANPFSDTEPEAAYAPYLSWGIENNLIFGTPDGTFQPEATLSREDTAVILYRYLTYRDNELSSAEATLPPGDFAQTADYAAEAVTALWNAGILTGTENKEFLPKTALTRAQTAVLLERCALLADRSSSELMTIPSFDGYPLQGKLDMPENQKAEKVVIFVNGSGPNTYDNRRDFDGKISNYFDIFADNFTKEGIAFFRTNTRGVTVGTEPPMFQEINEAEYQTYLPENSVRDTEEIIKALKQDPRLKDAKVYLLGWSEGTMIAPKVAARGNAPVDALLLGGYCNDTMEEIWNWQQSGESSMIFYRQCFDYNGDGHVTRAEFEEDRYQVQSYVNATFDQLDVNQNDELDAGDIAAIQAPFREQMLKAVEEGNDEWLKQNYGVQLTSAWFTAHRTFQPNREMLTELTIPIHIFHGVQDLNADVQGVYAIEEAFEQQKKTNLTAHVYEGADHNLNITNYMLGGALPQGFVDLFRIAADL